MLCTMFAFPAIALAMYQTAYKKNKPLVKSLMITCVVTALLGNVTEPLEFSFVFISPILYVICLLYTSHFNPRSREGSDKNEQKNKVLRLYFNPRSREGSDKNQTVTKA